MEGEMMCCNGRAQWQHGDEVTLGIEINFSIKLQNYRPHLPFKVWVCTRGLTQPMRKNLPQYSAAMMSFNIIADYCMAAAARF